MRIVLVSNRFYPSFGGIENSLFYVAIQLKKLGHEPIIFTGKHEIGLKVREDIEGIDVFRYTFPLLKLGRFVEPLIHAWFAAKSWNRVFKPGQVDAVWVRNASLGFSIYKASSGRIPIYYIPPVLTNSFYREDLAKFEGDLAQKVKKYCIYITQYPQILFFEQKIMKVARKIIVFSQNVKSQVIAAYPFTTNNVDVVKPGVDHEIFIPKEPDKDLQKQYGLENGLKVFLYVGRLTPEKNVATLVRAFSEIKAKSSILLLVGDGYIRDRLEELSEELGIRKRVVFTGYQKDTSGFYALAHFFVLPSFYEGFGQVYLEALSSGVPCIGYSGQFTATSEIIKDNINGIVVQEQSVNALSEALTQANNLSLIEYRRMCKAARYSVVDQYDWKKFVHSLLVQ